MLFFRVPFTGYQTWVLTHSHIFVGCNSKWLMCYLRLINVNINMTQNADSRMFSTPIWKYWLLMVNIIKFFPGNINNNNHQFQQMFFLRIDDMMAYKRPLVNWARIPGYWWIDSWDSLCSLHLCLTTGTDCTEKGAPHVHFFSLPSFLNGRNIPSRLKKGSENETFLHIFTWLHVFHGWKKPAPSRHQLRWTTFWTWIFGPALGVSDGRFGFARSKRHMDDDPPVFI